MTSRRKANELPIFSVIANEAKQSGNAPHPRMACGPGLLRRARNDGAVIEVRLTSS
jgi:hypothetical protein